MINFRKFLYVKKRVSLIVPGQKSACLFQSSYPRSWIQSVGVTFELFIINPISRPSLSLSARCAAGAVSLTNSYLIPTPPECPEEWIINLISREVQTRPGSSQQMLS